VIDPAAIWARLDDHNHLLREIRQAQIETLNLLGDIMTEVQLDSSVIDGATSALTGLASATESLVSAVTTFLASDVVVLPDADTSALTAALATAGTAVTDAGAAVTALADAAPPVTPPVTPPPVEGVPAVTSVTPSTGSVNGGDTVVIAGSGFTGATAVIFGLDAATSFTVISDTEIDAATPLPSAGAGTVDVTVTTPAGTSADSAADQFTTS
jgi:hypothetical protein